MVFEMTFFYNGLVLCKTAQEKVFFKGSERKEVF